MEHEYRKHQDAVDEQKKEKSDHFVLLGVVFVLDH